MQWIDSHIRDGRGGLYLTDFLRSSDWKCLPDNHEIYRKLIEKVNFIDSLPFLAG